MSEYEEEWKQSFISRDEYGVKIHDLPGYLEAADKEIEQLKENQLPDWLMHKSRKVDVRNLKECIKQQAKEIAGLKEDYNAMAFALSNYNSMNIRIILDAAKEDGRFIDGQYRSKHKEDTP